MYKFLKVVARLCLLALIISVGLWIAQNVEANQNNKRGLVKWAWYVRTQSSLDSLKSNLDNLTMLAPFYYVLKADGTIGGSDQPEVTQLAHSKGVKVLPMLQNDQYTAAKQGLHNLLANPDKVRQLVDAIETQIFTYGYDGYNIDFENISADDRPYLTRFIETLYKRLQPKDKLVTIAVVAKTRDVTTGWGGAYDYAALAPFVHYAAPMTYDYSYPGGSDGPVAPVNWVSAVAAYASSQFGPGKILLGVPFYGHDWSLNGGVSRSHGYDTILELIRRYNGTSGYDEVTQQAYADFTQDGDRRRVWFETPRSLAAKMDVIKRNNLAGWAAWRLGQEGSEFWPVLTR